MTEYIREDQMTRDEILAGVDGGTLQFLRFDASGLAWFKPMSMIQAVPPAELTAVADGDGDIEADDEPCLWSDEDDLDDVRPASDDELNRPFNPDLLSTKLEGDADDFVD